MNDLRYGPWSSGCAAGERGPQLRCMAAIVYMICGPSHELWKLLRAAETDERAYGEAYDAMERLPALTRRRILGTHNAVNWPRAPRSASQRRPYRNDLDQAEPVGKFCDLPEGGR